MANEKDTPISSGASLEGKTLHGHYFLKQKIGQGGMAWVYLAEHNLLREEVALKVLFPQLNDEREMRTRFIDEARIQFRLKHPNIAHVTDIFEDRGMLGIVQEWAGGQDLKSLFKRHPEPFSLKEIWDIFAPLLDALEYAHAQGVIHRDLKPGNILFRQQNAQFTPKLTDFGLAKVMESDLDGANTQTGVVMGTLKYMSPEQIRDSKHVDRRADIYSVGIILYRMATGKYPFQGKDEWIMYQQIHEAPPPPREVHPAISPAFEAILLKCLEKDPDARYPSCLQLTKALSQALRQAQQQPHPPATPSQANLEASLLEGDFDELDGVAIHRFSSSYELPALLHLGDAGDEDELPESTPPRRRPLPDLTRESHSNSKNPSFDSSHARYGISTRNALRADAQESKSNLSLFVIIGLLIGIAGLTGWWFGQPTPPKPLHTRPTTPNNARTQARRPRPRRPLAAPVQRCQEGTSRVCYTGPSGSQKHPPCKAGTQVCKDGRYGPCSGQITPAKEVCGNHKDDNCNGVIDEGCQWASAARSTSWGYALAITTSPQGQSYITGKFAGSAQFGKHALSAQGKSDLFVAKIDERGEFAWAVRAGGKGEDSGQGIALDPQGNILVAGFLSPQSSFGKLKLQPRTKRALVVAKLSPQGKFLWAKTVSSPPNASSQAHGIAADTKNNIVVTGSFQGALKTNTTLRTRPNTRSLLILKLDSQGTFVWTRQVPSAKAAHGTALVMDKRDNIYLTGSFTSKARFGNQWLTTNGDTPNIFVSKLNAKGYFYWTAKASGTGSDASYGIALDPKGGLYLAGWFEKSTSFRGIPLTNQSKLGWSSFVARLNHRGHFLWVRQLGGTNAFLEPCGNTLQVNPQGQLLTVGWFEKAQRFGNTRLVAKGKQDLFVSALNRRGKFLWSVQASGPLDQLGYATSLDAHGNLYIAGSFKGPTSLMQNRLASKNEGIFIWKLQKNPTPPQPPNPKTLTPTKAP